MPRAEHWLPSLFGQSAQAVMSYSFLKEDSGAQDLGAWGHRRVLA